jgi:hypothetical protein
MLKNLKKLSSVCGNLSGVCGNLSGVCGNLSGVCGNLSHVCGDLSGVCGNLDLCDIAQQDRDRGVNINQLIGGETAN